MKLYKCNVASGGDLGNVVVKSGVTVAEIYVLKGIHGGQAVTDIEPTGKSFANWSDRAELARLRAYYEHPDSRKLIDTLFGGVGVRLPVSLEEADFSMFEVDMPSEATPVETPTIADDDAIDGHLPQDSLPAEPTENPAASVEPEGASPESDLGDPEAPPANPLFD